MLARSNSVLIVPLYMTNIVVKDDVAREIYGAEAEEAFEPTVTSTSLGDEQFAEAG